MFVDVLMIFYKKVIYSNEGRRQLKAWKSGENCTPVMNGFWISSLEACSNFEEKDEARKIPILDPGVKYPKEPESILTLTP